MKQQSTDRNVAPLGHIIQIPSQYVIRIPFLNAACLAERQHIPILWFLLLSDGGSNPQYTTLEASTITITPPMWSWINIVIFVSVVETNAYVYKGPII